MAGILKVDTIQNANAINIVTQTNSTTLTIGAAGQTVSLDGGIIKSGSTTLTIGTSGQTVALASGATSSGFGATYNGAVNWSSTVQTTGFTAVSGTGYFVNTTSGAITVTLPASPSVGAIVAVSDYAKTWDTNNCILGINGSKINGLAVNLTLNTKGLSVTLVYIDSTRGWIVVNEGNQSAGTQAGFVSATGGTITTCGNYKIHTFTSSGCFVVTNAGNPGGSDTVDYLVTAGGGGGGGGDGTHGGGGGGGGGYRESVPSPAAWTASPLASPGGALPVSVTAYPITVGGGGAGGTPSPGPGVQGNPSVFSTITSAGGGLGEAAPVGTAGAGGSGGGAAGPGTGGAGNTPPTSPSQGSAGGSSPSNNSGGGGGGATAVGQDGAGPRAGGAGATTSISTSPTAYSGGGGGGFSDSQGCGTGGAGGTGGGGKGGDRPLTPSGVAVAGTTNTGGGGGGGANGPNASPLTIGAAGGSGIVVIRYKFQ
jgi:hypothetical protein